ncbi:unnamed protein product [Prorocentrum cordatum]|uniref:Uncharacterized protein n=1 Tax=Prorocentrum cordatum TaxID=2364126 RepID=A0ABN9TNE2_9DINO|nr:unnamed protein product [Polarella glacialis]
MVLLARRLAGRREVALGADATRTRDRAAQARESAAVGGDAMLDPPAAWSALDPPAACRASPRAPTAPGLFFFRADDGAVIWAGLGRASPSNSIEALRGPPSICKP